MPSVRTMLSAALAILVGAAHAAGDGLVGSESQATLAISFVKENAVRISGVSDVDFGSRASIDITERITSELCVFSSTGGYAVTAVPTSGAFELRTEDGLDTLPYRFQWISGGTVDLSPGVALGGLAGHLSKIDCNGRPNAKYRVLITPANFNNAEPGAYRDTLTLLVRPE